MQDREMTEESAEVRSRGEEGERIACVNREMKSVIGASITAVIIKR